MGFVDRKLDVEKLLSVLEIDARRRGREYWARCPSPDHEDRSPSWHIKADGGEKHGSHRCFSCGFEGGPAKLVLVVRRLDGYDDAFRWLREFRHGTQRDAKPVDLARWILRPPGHGEFVLPSEVVLEPMDRWVTLARRYAEQRGITAEQVERFGVGYAVSGWLAGRIVFPLRDRSGRPRSYAARTFVDDPTRYLTPFERDKPDVGAMFGEQFWPERSARRRIVLVEGAINALAVDRCSTLPFGTINGSEPQPAHVLKLSTFDEWILLTDPDAAGDKAAAMLDAARVGLDVRLVRVRLGPKEDAQSIGDVRLREVLAPHHEDRP